MGNRFKMRLAPLTVKQSGSCWQSVSWRSLRTNCNKKENKKEEGYVIMRDENLQCREREREKKHSYDDDYRFHDQALFLPPPLFPTD